MKIIGLTGSIGMGKSSTAGLLRALNIPVFDSDLCVHQLLSNQAIPNIIAAFPECWDAQLQQIDRAILGRIIFADPIRKETLENILHPLVWDAQQKFIAACRRNNQRIIVLDVPLLFETGRDKICDLTICVTAPSFLQRQRVLSRKGMNSEKYKAILNSQMPDLDKRLLADVVITTSLGKAHTLKKLKKILKSLS